MNLLLSAECRRSQRLLLVVVMVVSLLFPGCREKDKGSLIRTVADLQNSAVAIELQKVLHGEIAVDLEGLLRWLNHIQVFGMSINPQSFVDGWGRQILYDGSIGNEAGYLLRSSGPRGDYSAGGLAIERGYWVQPPRSQWASDRLNLSVLIESCHRSSVGSSCSVLIETRSEDPDRYEITLRTIELELASTGDAKVCQVQTASWWEEGSIKTISKKIAGTCPMGSDPSGILICVLVTPTPGTALEADYTDNVACARRQVIR